MEFFKTSRLKKKNETDREKVKDELPNNHKEEDRGEKDKPLFKKHITSKENTVQGKYQRYSSSATTGRNI